MHMISHVRVHNSCLHLHFVWLNRKFQCSLSEARKISRHASFLPSSITYESHLVSQFPLAPPLSPLLTIETPLLMQMSGVCLWTVPVNVLWSPVRTNRVLDFVQGDELDRIVRIKWYRFEIEYRRRTAVVYLCLKNGCGILMIHSLIAGGVLNLPTHVSNTKKFLEKNFILRSFWLASEDYNVELMRWCLRRLSWVGSNFATSLHFLCNIHDE